MLCKGNAGGQTGEDGPGRAANRPTDCPATRQTSRRPPEAAPPRARHAPKRETSNHDRAPPPRATPPPRRGHALCGTSCFFLHFFLHVLLFPRVGGEDRVAVGLWESGKNPHLFHFSTTIERDKFSVLCDQSCFLCVCSLPAAVFPRNAPGEPTIAGERIVTGQPG